MPAGEPAFTRDDLRNLWRILSPDERLEGFRLLPHDDAEEFFLALARADLASLMLELPKNERRAWMRLLSLDDAADLIQQGRQTVETDGGAIQGGKVESHNTHPLKKAMVAHACS